MLVEKLFRLLSNRMTKKFEADYCIKTNSIKTKDFDRLYNILMHLNFTDSERIELMRAVCCNKGWSFLIKETPKCSMN